MTKALKLELRLFAFVIVLLIFFMGMIVYAIERYGIGLPTCVTTVKPFVKPEIIELGPKHYEVHYVASMWRFEPADLQLPAGSEVDLYVSSIDVTHGFQIPGTDINLMVVPGKVNYARLKLDNDRSYQILCHEFCGAGHHEMYTTLSTTQGPLPSFTPLGAIQGAAGSTLSDAAKRGAELYNTKGCVACHSLDGKSGVGPTFKGIFSRKEQLADDTEIQVDEVYMRESIHSPNTKVVKGYEPVMPVMPMTDAELSDLIEYLKTL